MHKKLFSLFEDFKKDCLRIVIAVTNTILAFSMFGSPEPHNFFFWFTLAFRVLSVPVAVFAGNKALWVMYFVMCNVKAFDITYNNYTCVALISLLFFLLPNANRKQAVAFTFLYITDVFIVAGMHEKTGFYIYTHFLLSAQLLCAMWKVNSSKNKSDILVLTPDEITILNQLKDDEPIKTVEGFSEQTVYRKLKDARERNNCEDNTELRNRYKNSRLK